MTYSHEVEHMCVVKKGPNHGPSPQKSNMVKLPTAPCVCPRLDARTVFSG